MGITSPLVQETPMFRECAVEMGAVSMTRCALDKEGSKGFWVHIKVG